LVPVEVKGEEFEVSRFKTEARLLTSATTLPDVAVRRHGAHLDTAPFCKGFGAAMSSSPWEWLWNGDEDVATPFLAGAA
jgi:hypothetical protein